jgi:PII-like signaling protein
MHSEEKDLLLRIFIGENDHYKGRPLYETIVKKARELELAGATVLRGIMGFGADSRLKSAHVLDLSNDLPIIIEIIDRPEQVQKLLPFLDEVVTEGLVTLETIKVMKYRNRLGTETKR